MKKRAENLLFEQSLLEIFKNDMLLELSKNSHKGSILNFKDFSPHSDLTYIGGAYKSNLASRYSVLNM